MPKRIVVCLDGTWNKPESEPGGDAVPTNVLKLVRALCPTGRDGVAQVVFYDSGVGTGGRWDRLKGGALGIGLSQNIIDAYRFIANNHEEGDELFCFGFSRGAFTARSLGGMIGAVGLLKKLHMNRLPEAFEYYRTPPIERSSERAQALVASLEGTRPCKIRFLGVWDTVGALGIPVTWLSWLGARRYRFHDVTLGANVEHAYQALALDESRGPFQPTLWTRAPTGNPGQTVEQVWFSGAHANVGGGYRDCGLSDVALLWLIEKAQACHLDFDQAFIDRWIKPDAAAAIVDTRQGFYKYLRPYDRLPMRDGHFNELLHPSVLDRYRKADGSHLKPAVRKIIEDELARGDRGLASQPETAVAPANSPGPRRVGEG